MSRRWRSNVSVRKQLWRLADVLIALPAMLRCRWFSSLVSGANVCELAFVALIVIPRTSLPRLWDAGIRDIVMSMSVCLSVCPLAHLDNYTAELHRFFVRVSCGCEPVARSCSDGIAICYVLPVLWMTPCFLTMGFMARYAYFQSGLSITV